MCSIDFQFVSVCHARGFIEPISSLFGIRKIGDVTIPRYMTEMTEKL